MVAYGYLAFVVRAAPPHRTRNLQRLSDLGDRHVDLLTEVDRELTTMGNGFQRNEGMAEGYRLKSHTVRGRSLAIKIRRGPVGNPGETFDLESEETRETGANTALLSELRAALYVPRDSYFGFLFVERVGGRHIKDLLYKRVIKEVALRTNMAIRVEAFAQTDDWRRELQGQQVLRVTELLTPTSTAHDASTLDEVTVRVTAEGAGLAPRGGELKDRIFDLLDRRHEEYRVLAQVAPLEDRRRVWGKTRKRDGTVKEGWKTAPKSSFSVADQEELATLLRELEELNGGSDTSGLREDLQSVLPVDRDEYESQRVEVSFGHDRPEKTFVVTGDRVPQLVYEFGGWLLDSELQAAWDSTAMQFLGGLGVNLSVPWPIEASS